MNITPKQKRPPDWTDAPAPTQVKQCVQNYRGITALPRELVQTILANLGGKDLVVCQRVTRGWKDIIESAPILPRLFYRRMHPLAPVPELSVTCSSNHWPSIRHRLKRFSEQGRKLVIAFDELVRDGAQLSPERLFFSLAKVLAEAPVLYCRKAYIIKHTDWIEAGSFSPDGRYVVTTSDDHTAKVCECIDGQWQQTTTLDHTDSVYGAHFSPTGAYCVTTCFNGTIKIWEVLGAGGPWHCHLTLPHYSFLFMPCFSADGNYLFICPTANTPQIYQLVNGQWQKQTILLEGDRVNRALFHPREPMLATVHNDANVYIWRLVDSQWKNETILQRLGYVSHIYFSPAGNRFMVTCTTNIPTRGAMTAYIYDSADGTWPQEAAVPFAKEVQMVRFSPNGDTLVAVFIPKGIAIWQFSDNRWQEVILPQTETFTSACFSPDGDRLVTNTKHNTAILWREVEGHWQQQATLNLGAGGTDELGDSLFSPYGHQLVTLSFNEDAKIWGIVNGTWQEKSCRSLGRVRTGTFSPDGLYLLTLSWEEHAVNIWTFQPGQL